MNKPRIDILINGFSDEGNLKEHGTARYQPNIVLIRVDELAIVVDPGTVEKQSLIADALAKHGLSIQGVTHIIHTHHHLDHNRNTGMFANIPVIDAWAIWNGVDYDTKPRALHEAIRTQSTPGHSYDSLTVFVETEEGVVAICGDVFWWEGDTQSDVYATDIEELKKADNSFLSNLTSLFLGTGLSSHLRNRF